MEQCSLWEKLLWLSAIEIPWMVARDFNAYLSVNEKRSQGAMELGPKSKAFANFVNSAGLCDIEFDGLPYTEHIVEDVWAPRGRGNSMHVLMHKVCTLQRAMRRWNRDVVGDIEAKLVEVRKELEALEEMDATTGLDVGGLGRLRSLYHHKTALSRQINVKWLQRARLKWMQGGDKITKFFHLMVSIRQHKNRILGIFYEDRT
ncbi:uncharacterized protein [Typha angustifolia]|uniref:uncharacterized protein n=1 Tax=Typha angustifolia TaxID=59011 RepID=UPI003C2C437D